ncbi:hypothetical protein KZY64_02260 [Prevotella histicola]|uniref:hypothetical protein n=1 Tax=Prevotella histicola TaxID=470565 RepID=UPI001C5D628B|nr:hypothetical protein [Prevotella histicola]MBW4876004.1 hypothetical protein [Prevotella histicola]
MNISELIPQIAIIVIAGSIYFSIKTIVAWMKRLEREFNVIYDKLDLVQKLIEDKTEKWAELEAAMDEINKETKSNKANSIVSDVEKSSTENSNA